MVSPRVEGATSAPRQKGWLTPPRTWGSRPAILTRDTEPRARRRGACRGLLDSMTRITRGRLDFNGQDKTHRPHSVPYPTQAGPDHVAESRSATRRKIWRTEFESEIFRQNDPGDWDCTAPQAQRQRTCNHSGQQQGHVCYVTMQSERQGLLDSSAERTRDHDYVRRVFGLDNVTRQ